MAIVIDDRPAPEETRWKLRPWQAWFGLGALTLGLLLLASINQPPEFCPEGLPDAADPNYEGPPDVVCDSPIVGTWQPFMLQISGSPSALPFRWDGGTGGTVTFLADGRLVGHLCNHFSTHFQVSDTVLKTSEVARTVISCAARPERIEGIIFSALGYADATFSVTEGARLWSGPRFWPGDPGPWDEPPTPATSENQVLTITSGDVTMVFQRIGQ